MRVRPIIGNGGVESDCGWCKDRWGVSWQITPRQLLELTTAAVAMAIDRKPRAWRLLPLLLIQRFCYRQLLCVIAMQVTIAALKGRMLGWNKLIRTGSVALGSTSNYARPIATG